MVYINIINSAEFWKVLHSIIGKLFFIQLSFVTPPPGCKGGSEVEVSNLETMETTIIIKMKSLPSAQDIVK